MNVFRETGSFVTWYGAVLGTLVRARPLTTIALIMSSVGAKLANILARLLPLKVILLAGSNGVPSYFRPFLSPEQKTLGLVVLVLAAVGCYIADPVLEALANKLSESGSRKVVENANDIVLTEHRQQAQSTFVEVTGMTAELLFAVVFFSVILRTNPSLVLLLIAFFAVVFVATAWIVRGNIYEGHRPLAIFIADDFGAYLDVLSVLTFIVAFLFIIAPFLTGGTGNILLAMLAIAFLRRTLRSLTHWIRTAAKLTGKNHKVNALIFRGHRIQRRERPEIKILRDLFDSRLRHNRTAREISLVKGPVAGMQTQWLDPTGGTHHFAIDLTLRSGERRHYVERVFPQARISRLDNEEFLFRHIPREALLAPPVVTRFTTAPFECLISDLGIAAMPARRDDWKQTHAGIVETLWGCLPPEALVHAHRSSYAELHERLTPEFLERATIAVNSEGDEKLFADLLRELPRFQEELRSLPLHISNPGFGPHNVWQCPNSDPVILDWGDWSIQPLGVGHLPLRGNPNAIDAIIGRLRTRRSDIPASLTAAGILLAADCVALERAIERNMFRTALIIAQDLIGGASGGHDQVDEEGEDLDDEERAVA